MLGVGWADDDVKDTVILSDYVSIFLWGGVDSGGSFVCLGMFAGKHAALALLRHLAAKHLQHQRGELHAMLRLE